ncbi:hypothetical protein LB553_16190 [Mesorhizobium sp. CA8]|nr:hypothetical protein [Mesorhizobium sp. CA8]
MALTFAEENLAWQARGCKKGHRLRSFERLLESVVFIGAVFSSGTGFVGFRARVGLPSSSVHILYKIV